MSEAWMSRLVFQAWCFVIGVVVGKMQPLPEGQIPFLYGLFAVFLVLSIFAFVRSRRTHFPVIVAVILFGCSTFFLGWGRCSSVYIISDPGHISQFAKDSWKDRGSVEGVIATDPEIYADRVTFTLAPLRVKTGSSEGEYHEVTGGQVDVTIRREAGEYYREYSNSGVYGWRIRVNAPLIRPPGPLNPGGFSYRTMLEDQDVYATQTVAVSWGSPPPVEILDRAEGFFLTEWALAIKEKIMYVFVHTMPYPESTFLSGVTLGTKYILQNTHCIIPSHDILLTDECRVAGVSHVLAVSGLHVTIISGMFLAIFAALKIPMRVSAPIIVLFLVIFLIITGMPPSATRATFMNSLTIFFLAISKGTFRQSFLFSIAQAAMVVLFINPKYLIEPSFTLSFAAVLSLGLISVPVERLMVRLKGIPFLYLIAVFAVTTVLSTVSLYDSTLGQPAFYYGWFGCAVAGFVFLSRRFSGGGPLDHIGFESVHPFLRAFLVAQVAILVGMMYPLSSFYFGRYSLAGPYSNLIVIPLTGFITPLGLLAGLVGMIPGVGMFVALVLNAANDMLVKLFFYITHYSTMWFPYPYVVNFTASRLGVYYAILAVFIWWEPLWGMVKNIYFRHYKHATDPAIRRNVLGMAIVGGALAVVAGFQAWQRPPPFQPGVLRMTFFSVGFGNTAAALTPTGKSILIDGALNDLRAHIDVGQRVLAPYFLKEGLRGIDHVVLTCPGIEHTEGLASILNGLDVGRLYDPIALQSFDRFVDAVSTDTARAYNMFLDDLDNPYLSENRSASYVRRMYDGYAALAEAAGRRGIPRTRANAGVEVDKGTVNGRPFRAYFVGPGGAFRDYRDQSAVFKIEYGAFSVLFTGDIGDAAIDRLLQDDATALQSDILVVPNHGQKPAARRADFVRAVRPSMVIFQSGKFERFFGRSRKAQPLVDKAKEDYDANVVFFQEWVGADRVFETHRQGAVIIESDGKNFRVQTMKGMTHE